MYTCIENKEQNFYLLFNHTTTETELSRDEIKPSKLKKKIIVERNGFYSYAWHQLTIGGVSVG